MLALLVKYKSANTDAHKALLALEPSTTRRFEDFSLTRARAEEQIAQHESSMQAHIKLIRQLEQQSRQLHVEQIARRETRDMCLALESTLSAQQQAVVHESKAKEKMTRRNAAVANMCQALLDMAQSTQAAVSLDEDAAIKILASQLNHALLIARAGMTCVAMAPEAAPEVGQARVSPSLLFTRRSDDLLQVQQGIASIASADQALANLVSKQVRKDALPRLYQTSSDPIQCCTLVAY